MKTIALTDAGLFFRYDKGYAVVSKPLSFLSHRPRPSDSYAHWYVQSIGDPTVPTNQELGVPDLSDRSTARLLAPMRRGDDVAFVEIEGGKTPAVDWEVGARDAGHGYIQGFGRVLTSSVQGYAVRVQLERKAAYDYPFGTSFYFYPPAVVPSDNLFLPRRARVRVSFDEQGSASNLRAAPVVVLRRNTPRGKASFFFLDRVATLEEEDAAALDAGFYAFVACHPLQEIAVKIGETYYTHFYNEAAAPFEVVVEGGEPGHLLTAGVTARNAPQPEDRRKTPGETTAHLNGVPLRADDGRVLATYGDVYLRREGQAVYLAWNDFGYDASARAFFPQCKLGRLDGATVRKLFVDRWGPDWHLLPSFELAGGIINEAGVLYGGRVRRDRNWVPTALRIVWAAPPQDNLPEGYDGGYAAVIMVAGDRTETLRAGASIRLGGGPDGEVAAKEYVLSEVGSGVRYVAANSPFALDDSWRGVTAVFTWAIILEIDHGARNYLEQVRLELLGKYIHAAHGACDRYEVWRYRP